MSSSTWQHGRNIQTHWNGRFVYRRCYHWSPSFWIDHQVSKIFALFPSSSKTEVFTVFFQLKIWFRGYQRGPFTLHFENYTHVLIRIRSSIEFSVWLQLLCKQSASNRVESEYWYIYNGLFGTFKWEVIVKSTQHKRE